MKKRTLGRLEFVGLWLTVLGGFFLIFKEVNLLHLLILLSGIAISTFGVIKKFRSNSS